MTVETILQKHAPETLRRFAHLSDRLRQMTLATPVEFWKRPTRRFGQFESGANGRAARIKLHASYRERLSEPRVLADMVAVLLHEAAHAICDYAGAYRHGETSHGPAWKAQARALGVATAASQADIHGLNPPRAERTKAHKCDGCGRVIYRRITRRNLIHPRCGAYVRAPHHDKPRAVAALAGTKVGGSR